MINDFLYVIQKILIFQKEAYKCIEKIHFYFFEQKGIVTA